MPTLELENVREGSDFRLLARDVNRMIPYINSLMNMTCLLEGKSRGVGQLEMRGDKSFLRMFTTPGGFGPTIPVTVQVTSNKNPANVGDTVNFTATIVPTISVAVNATGTIQFYIDNVAFGSAVSLVNGIATSGNTTSLTLGDHSIQASYSGDDNFFPKTGTMTETIKYATSLSLSSSENPTTVTRSVHFTATLSGTNINSATGTVQFYIDGQPFGAAVNVSGGQAVSGSTSWSSTGSHTINAHYSGDSQYASADAGALNETVGDSPSDYFINGTLTPTYPGTYSYSAYAQHNTSNYGTAITDIPGYQGQITVTIQVFSTAPGGGTDCAINGHFGPTVVNVINGVATFNITPNGPSCGFRIHVQDNAFSGANDTTLGIFS